jgi:acetyl-CoA C-acetyltransferase
MGGFQGACHGVKATELGATAVKAAVERAGLSPAKVEQIYMGCVLPAGLGQAPARQAAHRRRPRPAIVEATTVNKMCGSGLQAVMMASDSLAAGSADVIVAGGMESMSGAPYLMTKHRGGARIGHDVIVDSMYMDGLEDAYTPGKLMGNFAEDSAQTYQFTRESPGRICAGKPEPRAGGHRLGRLQGRDHPGRGHVTQGRGDRHRGRTARQGHAGEDPDLKPAFAKDGTITAANAQFDLGRRRGPGDDPRELGEGHGPADRRPGRQPFGPRP